MKKLILLILLLPTLCFGGSIQDAHKAVIARMNAALSCTLEYDPVTTYSLVADLDLDVNAWSHDDYSGTNIIPDGNWAVCEVDIYIRDVNGDLSAASALYYVQIYSLDGSTPKKLNTLVCTSAGLLGGDLDSAGDAKWFSETDAGRAVFTGCNLTSGTYYGFVVFRDTDANITDEPEYSSTNFMEIGYDDEKNADAIQGGKDVWVWDASIPYDSGEFDLQDDLLIKIWTMQ